MPAKIICDHDVYVFHAPFFELGEDLEPGMGALPLAFQKEEARGLPSSLVSMPRATWTGSFF
jgi:hypothetical protein